MRELNINTTAKMAKLMREVQNAGKTVDTWVAGNDH
jgi:hypothetical protein